MSDNITAIPFTRNPVIMCKKMPPPPKNNWIEKLSNTDEHTKECQLYKDTTLAVDVPASSDL
jgi:hypothetical protein